MRKLLVCAFLAACAALTGPANAATYEFTFVGNPETDPGVYATGTFTTNAANDLIIFGSGVFSFGPSVDEAAMLVPGSGQIQQLTFDNLFPIDAANGILFEGTSDPNFLFNIYAIYSPTGTTLGVGVWPAWASAEDGAGFYFASLSFPGACNNCTAVGILTISEIPEPGAWALMLVGFGGLGLAALRRRRPPISALE